MATSVSASVRASICTVLELVPEDRELLERACAVRESTQSPYSKYAVGAAVRTQSGEVYVGCNVEYATLTQTIHAEQNAIGSAVTDKGPVKITDVAVVAGLAGVRIDLSAESRTPLITDISDVKAPCGHCLQIIWEHCMDDPDVRLILLAPNGQVVVTSIGSALPMRFGPTDLGIHYGA